MIFSSSSDRDQFLTAHGFRNVLEGNAMPGRHLFSYCFETEDHTQSVFTLAKMIASLSDCSESTLFILDKTWVWASARDDFLVSTMLKEIAGPAAKVSNDVGMFVWDASETTKAVSLYHLALLFGWDAYIYPRNKNCSAFISHDGFVELRSDMEPADFMAVVQERTKRKFRHIP